jgi:hypothetical protein
MERNPTDFKPDELDLIERRYNDGVPVRDISKELGHSFKYFNRRLRHLIEIGRLKARRPHPKTGNTFAQSSKFDQKIKQRSTNTQELFTTKIPLDCQEKIRALAKFDYGTEIKDIVLQALNCYFKMRANVLPEALKKYREQILKNNQ